MARGGINRVQVENAYKAIQIRGENPSIDAIRAEMGNTGSKSTIHRYLKEIQDEKTSEQTEEERLTKPLKSLITDMVQALRQHANKIVEDNNRDYDKRIAHLNERNHELSDNHKQQVKQIETLTRQLNEAVSLGDSQKSSLTQQEQQIQGLLQTEKTQQTLLDEKGAHIASLEQKHQHSREALEHYRTSVKEMRDQDMRKHDAQVQQLQAQIQQLGQTLQVKQSDITVLNKDNGRLAEELKQLQKITSQEASNHKQAASTITQLQAE